MRDEGLITPWSAQLSLHEVLQRLGTYERVRAVSFLGSTGTEDWTDASDYDLCVLLRDYPARFGVEATIVDGRIADIVIVDADQAARLGHRVAHGGEGSAAGGMPEIERTFVRWLAQSRPVLDHDGVAARARGAAAQLMLADIPVTEDWQQTTRSFVTHDLRVNAALLCGADDSLVRVALGMRQLHTFVTTVQAWFTARGLQHEGWKKDIAAVAQADPVMLEIIERWLNTTDLTSRHEIFAEAAARALEPIGGPLPVGTLLRQSDDVWETMADRSG